MDNPVTGYYDWYANRGASSLRTFIWKDADENPRDLTGYTAQMQVRRAINSTSPELSLVSPTDITVGTFNGSIFVEIDYSAMEDIGSQYTTVSYIYDLELTSPGGVRTRLLEGRFIVSPEVTR